MKSHAAVCAALCFLLVPAAAHAQETVECQSHNYQYNECQAPLRQPQLVHQISSSSCIINRTWGYNPNTHRIWVSQGCSGVFADVRGYHHGRDDGYDRGARYYDDRGHDAGLVTAGVVAAIISAAASDSHRSHSHTTSNSGYSGCHGIGCTVDNPDARDGDQDIDTRPAFDKQGNPNFDTHGNYQGCHGVGCDVDPPPQDDGGN